MTYLNTRVKKCFILSVFFLLCCIWFFPTNSVSAVEEETIADRLNYQNGFSIPDYVTTFPEPTTEKYVMWSVKNVSGGVIRYYNYTFSIPDDVTKLSTTVHENQSYGTGISFDANGKGILGRRYRAICKSSTGELTHEQFEDVNMFYSIQTVASEPNGEGKILFSNIPIEIGGKIYDGFDGSYVPPKNCEITFPTKCSIVAGYLPPAFDVQPNQGLLMDIKVKGSFKWNLPFGSSTKSYLTSVQNSFIVKLGDKTKSVLGGVGVKTVLDIEEQFPKKGDTVNFTVTLYIPVWQKGENLDLTVGYSCYNDGEWTYFSDSITVTTTQTNSDIVDGDEYIPPGEGESNGSVDGNENGWFPPSVEKPSEDNKNILDWLKYWIDCIKSFFVNLFNSILSFFNIVKDFIVSFGSFATEMSTAFTGLFGFLPSPIPQLINLSIVIMITVTVISFVRGR